MACVWANWQQFFNFGWPIPLNIFVLQSEQDDSQDDLNTSAGEQERGYPSYLLKKIFLCVCACVFICMEK